jgi:hypothetical protein
MFPFIVSTNNYKTLFYKRRSLIYKVRLNNKYVQTYPMPFRKENNMLLIFFMRILFQKNIYLQKQDLFKWMLISNIIADLKSKISSLKVLFKSLNHHGRVHIYIFTHVILIVYYFSFKGSLQG